MPASMLRLRSGFSDGLSVNAISKASGGRMPVPADARSFVAFGVAGPRYQATASLGLAETSALGRERRPGAERIGHACEARRA